MHRCQHQLINVNGTKEISKDIRHLAITTATIYGDLLVNIFLQNLPSTRTRNLAFSYLQNDTKANNYSQIQLI